MFDINNHTRESLNFIFLEADKLLSESLKSLSNITNRSTYILLVYLSALSFSFVKILEGNFWFYSIFLSSIIASLILFRNILPVKTCPRGLDLDFFDNEIYSDNKKADVNYDIVIYCYNEMSKVNLDSSAKMNKRYRTSIIFFVLLIALSGLILIFKAEIKDLFFIILSNAS